MKNNSSAIAVRSEHARVCRTLNAFQKRACSLFACLCTRKNNLCQCRNMVLGRA